MSDVFTGNSVDLNMIILLMKHKRQNPWFLMLLVGLIFFLFIFFLFISFAIYISREIIAFTLCPFWTHFFNRFPQNRMSSYIAPISQRKRQNKKTNETHKAIDPFVLVPRSDEWSEMSRSCRALYTPPPVSNKLFISDTASRHWFLPPTNLVHTRIIV